MSTTDTIFRGSDAPTRHRHVVVYSIIDANFFKAIFIHKKTPPEWAAFYPLIC